MSIVDGIIGLVGNTPLVRLCAISPEGGADVLAKLELRNPGGSLKDRPALSMLRKAEADGILAPGDTLVEATSGNMGISLAMLSAVRGYRCVIVMPEDMSPARRAVLKAYGAEVILTEAEEGMAGSVQHANAIVRERRGVMLSQFENPANPDAHAATTAEEIWDATEGKLDAFVAGVGTGGTLTGVGRVLKARDEKIKLVAVEPRSSAVLSGGQPALHGIQGLGAGFIPEVLDTSLIDQIKTVSDLGAERMMRRIAEEEGLLVGPSTGANVHAAVEIAQSLSPGQRVVTIVCDLGERYYG